LGSGSSSPTSSGQSELLQLLQPQFPDQTLSLLPTQSYRSKIFQLEPSGLILKYRAGGCADEARILSWLSSHQFPSPPLIGIGPDWILMGKLPGELQDPGNHRTYRSLGKLLGRLNALPGPFPEVESMTIEGCHAWADFCIESTQFLGLSAQIRSALEPIYQAKTLGPTGLIHNGPFWKNVLAGPGGQVTALIDWEYALVGPHDHQIGTTLAFLAHPGMPVTQEQVRRRQLLFLEGYGAPETDLLRSFQVLRLLDSLAKGYRSVVYAPGEHLCPQGEPQSREDYQRLTRIQAELGLRMVLQ